MIAQMNFKNWPQKGVEKFIWYFCRWCAVFWVDEKISKTSIGKWIHLLCLWCSNQLKLFKDQIRKYCGWTYMTITGHNLQIPQINKNHTQYKHYSWKKHGVCYFCWYTEVWGYWYLSWKMFFIVCHDSK